MIASIRFGFDVLASRQANPTTPSRSLARLTVFTLASYFCEQWWGPSTSATDDLAVERGAASTTRLRVA
jgi:hypothetical protein